MSRPRSAVHTQHSTTRPGGSNLDLDLDAASIRKLAAGIIEQTVRDWTGLIQLEEDEKKQVKHYSEYEGEFQGRKVGSETSYTEIRQFFRSDYGEMLCDMIEIAPDRILGALEGWLKDYRERGVLPKSIRRMID